MASRHPPLRPLLYHKKEEQKREPNVSPEVPPPGPSTVESRRHGPTTNGSVDEGGSNVPTASTARRRGLIMSASVDEGKGLL